MKAKSNFSALVAGSVAKGALGLFAVLTIFIAGFVAWSTAGVAVALIGLF